MVWKRCTTPLVLPDNATDGWSVVITDPDTVI
jgi:hypothetical protein